MQFVVIGDVLALTTRDSMETLYLPQSIFGKDFESVYEPAEDTYLLLDALEKDLDLLRKNVRVCVECGSGSGTVITSLSKSLQQYETISRVMIATDNNLQACKTTKKCATYHGQHNIEVVHADLVRPLVEKLSNEVDLLIFNAPYVPTDEEEVVVDSEDKRIYSAWAGGPNGRMLIDRFLMDVPRLLSKPHGVAYLVVVEQNNVVELIDSLKDCHGLHGTVSMKRKAGIESLFVIKYAWV